LKSKSYASTLALFSIYFIDSFGAAIVFPIFTTLLLDPTFGRLVADLPYFLRPLFLGLLISAYPLAQLLSWPIFAKIATHRPRKIILIISTLLLALGFIFTGTSLVLKSYTLLFFSRFFSGFCAGSFILCIITPDDLAHKFIAFYHKRLTHIAGVGFMIGILAGGTLSDPRIFIDFNTHTPFIFGFFITLFTLTLVIYTLPKITTKETQRKNALFVWKGFFNNIIQEKTVLPYLTFFLFLMAWLTNLQFFSFEIHKFYGHKPLLITFVLIGMVFAYMIGFFQIYKSISKIMPQKPLLIFSLAGALGIAIIIYFSTNLFADCFFHVIFSLYAGLIWACLSDYIVHEDALMNLQLVAYKNILVLGATCIAPLLTGSLLLINIHFIFLFASISLLLSITSSLFIEK